MEKRNSGFTLIELAVVFAVVMFFIASSTSLLLKQLDPTNYNVTQIQVSNLQAALNTYYQKYGNLPCPSRLAAKPTDSDYQQSVASCTIGSCTSGIDCTSSIYAVGAFPAQTLVNSGIASASAIDQWGNKVLYAIDPNFNKTNAARFCVFKGGIPIRDSSGATYGNAQYIILSSGKNGAGGYTKNGAASNSCLSGASETSNCTYSGNFFTTAIYNDVPNSASYFDDIIAWQPNPNYAACPAGVGGCTLWVNASDICATTGTGSTLSMKDLSITGADAARSNGSPAFNSGANNINGFGYVTTATATSDVISGISTNFSSYTNGMTVIIAFNQTTQAAATLFTQCASISGTTCTTPSFNIGISASTFNPQVLLTGATTIVSSSTVSANTPSIITASTGSTGNTNLFLNGISNNGFFAYGSTPAASTRFMIGNGPFGGFTGAIYEVIVYNRVLSTLEQNAVESYLAKKWNVPYL